MRTWDTARRITVVLMWWLVVSPAPSAIAQQSSLAATGSTQEALTRAKGLYASAEFEDALQLLETLRGPAASPEAAAYQVYCLVALDRRDEARMVVERIVRVDPLFRPAEGQVAPRVRAFFDDARKPLLPEVARQAYARARIAYDRKDMASAVVQFDRAIELFDEIGGADPGMTDLRTLAASFRDLARTASAPAPSPKPDPPSSSTNAPVVPAEPAIYGAQHTNVIAPVPISRHLPEWHPSFFELNHTFSGDIELVIGEDGKVLSASMLTSVHPRYDGALLDAAKSWTFKPATKNGVPVKYRYIMAVQILK